MENYKNHLATLIIVCFVFISNAQTAQELILSAQNKGRIGEYEASIADYNSAIALDSSNALAYAGRGSAFYFLEKKRKCT